MDRDIMAAAILLKIPFPVNAAAATVTTTLTKGTAPAPPNGRGIRVHSITRGIDIGVATPNLAVSWAAYAVQFITNGTTAFSVFEKTDTPVNILREWENPPYIPWGTAGTVVIQADMGAVATQNVAIFLLYSYY